MAPFFFFLTISCSLSESISISGNVTQMHIISKNSKWSCEISPNSLLFSEAAALKPNKCWELNSTALNQAAVSSWLNVEGAREREREDLILLFKHLTKHKSPLMCVCEMCQKGRGDERVTQEKLAAGRRTPLGGTLGWTLLGSFRRMAWPIDRRGTTVLYRQLD